MLNPVHGIITKGLGLPAGNSMIVAFFQLGYLTATVTPVPVYNPPTNGGSVPLRPGQIANFYKPVEQPITPWNNNIPSQKQYVKVSIQFNGGHNTKEFLLPKQSLAAKASIKTIEMVDKTIRTIVATITNLKIIKKQLKAKIENLKIKR